MKQWGKFWTSLSSRWEGKCKAHSTNLRRPLFASTSSQTQFWGNLYHFFPSHLAESIWLPDNRPQHVAGLGSFSEPELLESTLYAPLPPSPGSVWSLRNWGTFLYRNACPSLFKAQVKHRLWGATMVSPVGLLAVCRRDWVWCLSFQSLAREDRTGILESPCASWRTLLLSRLSLALRVCRDSCRAPGAVLYWVSAHETRPAGR